jgi:UDPglucose 6-dehydrogenase
MYKIGIIGMGFVGGAMYNSFKEKKIYVVSYDKYKDSEPLEECFSTDILFLCLPTLFNEELNSYDTSAIIETCDILEQNSYNGIVVIKSTVEPETTSNLQKRYKKLQLAHNPEFLTARTAYEDFNNQQHIVLGKTNMINENTINKLYNFYHTYYPNAEISICSSTESEAMKIYLNCFYAVKIQFFNELYLLSENLKCNHNRVVELMLKNKWINPMHTTVPGPDGMLSYGGYCFPKDTNALLNHMKRYNTPHMVLNATIEERNLMRDDTINIIKK